MKNFHYISQCLCTDVICFCCSLNESNTYTMGKSRFTKNSVCPWRSYSWQLQEDVSLQIIHHPRVIRVWFYRHQCPAGTGNGFTKENKTSPYFSEMIYFILKNLNPNQANTNPCFRNTGLLLHTGYWFSAFLDKKIKAIKYGKLLEVKEISETKLII